MGRHRSLLCRDGSASSESHDGGAHRRINAFQARRATQAFDEFSITSHSDQRRFADDRRCSRRNSSCTAQIRKDHFECWRSKNLIVADGIFVYESRSHMAGRPCAPRSMRCVAPHHKQRPNAVRHRPTVRGDGGFAAFQRFRDTHASTLQSSRASYLQHPENINDKEII